MEPSKSLRFPDALGGRKPTYLDILDLTHCEAPVNDDDDGDDDRL